MRVDYKTFHNKIIDKYIIVQHAFKVETRTHFCFCAALCYYRYILSLHCLFYTIIRRIEKTSLYT